MNFILIFGLPIILGIAFLIFLFKSVINADDAIEDDEGHIIGYQRQKKNEKIDSN
jgi:hypothetical protein